MPESIMRTSHTLALCLGLVLGATLAPGAHAASASDPGYARFRDTLKELIETNTTLSAGDCTLAAQRMGARLKAAGYPDSDVRVFVPEGHPKEGGLLAVLHGTDPGAKAILELAHIDVVEAKREDWVRDPFTFIEDNGSYYARGVFDMKSQAAIWVDSFVRFREERYHPKHTIKLALTCGEESGTAVDGAQWLTGHELPAIEAGLAITEGMDGLLDAQGHRVMLGVEASEKLYQDFQFEVTNPGGHSSRPLPDNAIYRLNHALDRVSRHEFPVRMIDATRFYFTRMAKIVGGQKGAAMSAFVKDPQDAKALAVIDQDKFWHAMLRTTCVATMESAGHAPNALPQRATANVNCRILPGETPAGTLATLTRLVNDPAVHITPLGKASVPTKPMALTPAILGPIETIAAQVFPGVPVVPGLEPGASDAVFTVPAGIPTLGVTGLFAGPDGGNMHGLDEHVAVQSVVDAREFLVRLVKAYADQ
jgi:acetylornithine deacetylase/succinyl-diaminopimelate desuccinylase-like protein